MFVFGVKNAPARVGGGGVLVYAGYGPTDILKLSDTASCTILESIARAS
jgi:hypothetical protein